MATPAKAPAGSADKGASDMSSSAPPENTIPLNALGCNVVSCGRPFRHSVALCENTAPSKASAWMDATGDPASRMADAHGAPLVVTTSAGGAPINRAPAKDMEGMAVMPVLETLVCTLAQRASLG